MAAVGIRCGGNPFLNCRLESENLPLPNQSGHVGPTSLVVNHVDLRSRCRRGRMRISMSSSPSWAIEKKAVEKDEGEYQNKAAVVYEKMDEWMRDSVNEIVKNLGEAPMLVQLYWKQDGETTRLRTEKGVEEEDWRRVIDKWKTREMPVPEGLIFVEQLMDNNNNNNNNGEEEEMTRAWGIVVQGKGVECGPVCYLLKTSRGVVGGGISCTHFCLMRVNSFRESAISQLQNCWLSSS